MSIQDDPIAMQAIADARDGGNGAEAMLLDSITRKAAEYLERGNAVSRTPIAKPARPRAKGRARSRAAKVVGAKAATSSDPPPEPPRPPAPALVLHLDDVAAILRIPTDAVRALHEHEGLPLADVAGCAVVSRRRFLRWLDDRTEPAAPRAIDVAIGGRSVSFSRASELIGYPSPERPTGGALKKAVGRAPEGDPLFALRAGGPARTANGHLLEDAVLVVAAQLARDVGAHVEAIEARKAAARALGQGTTRPRREDRAARLAEALSRTSSNGDRRGQTGTTFDTPTRRGEGLRA